MLFDRDFHVSHFFRYPSESARQTSTVEMPRRSSIQLWKSGVSKVVTINRSSSLFLKPSLSSTAEPEENGLDNKMSKAMSEAANRGAPQIQNTKANRKYMLKDHTNESIEAMPLGLVGEIYNDRVAVEKANDEVEASEDNASSCAAPQLFGGTEICVVCGRHAKAHRRYKKVDNPAAERAKVERTIKYSARQNSARQKAKVYTLSRVDDIASSSGPPQGGYLVLFTGHGFVDNGPQKRWARFGDAYAKLNFVSSYRLTCLCPARQSVFCTVEVELTLNGGYTWLAVEGGWTYAGGYTFASMLQQEAGSSLFMWGKDCEDPFGTENVRQYYHDHRIKVLDASEISDMKKPPEDQVIASLANDPKVNDNTRKTTSADQRVQTTFALQQVCFQPKKHKLHLLTSEGIVISDQRHNIDNAKEIPANADSTNSSASQQGAFDGSISTTFCLDEKVSLDPSKSEKNKLGITQAAGGSMRIDDHRFSPREKLSYATVLAETSWFFCAPDARQRFLANEKESQDSSTSGKQRKKRLTRRRRRSSRNKESTAAKSNIQLPALALHPFSLAALTLTRWRRIIKISCGSAHSAFLSGVIDGHVLYMCGENVYGQLGLGDRKARSRLAQVTSFMRPSARSKGEPRRAYKVQDVTCGPEYTVAVAFHAFKSRYAIFSWGKANVFGGSYNLRNCKVPLRQGKLHPLTYVKRQKHLSDKIPAEKNPEKMNAQTVSSEVVSLSNDVLTPLQILRFEVNVYKGKEEYMQKKTSHSLLKPFVLPDNEMSDKPIGHKSFCLPITIMPISLAIYTEEAFETWLRHSENMTGCLWNTLNRNAEYEISDSFLESRSKHRMSNHLLLTNSPNRRSMQLELKVVREAIDSLDRNIGVLGALCEEIVGLEGGSHVSARAYFQRAIKHSGRAGGRIFGRLEDEIMKMLTKTTKSRDTCLHEVNSLKELEVCVSEVLYHLGKHQNKITSKLAELKSGEKSQEHSIDMKSSHSSLGMSNSNSFPKRTVGVEDSRLKKLAAAASKGKHSGAKGIYSTRFDIITDGAPIAADQVRRELENAYKPHAMGPGTSNLHERNISFEPGSLYSWFNNKGEAIEARILLPVDIGSVGGRGRTKETAKLSGTGEAIETVSQCKQELKCIRDRVGEMSRCRLHLHSELLKCEEALAHKNEMVQMIQRMVQDAKSVDRQYSGRGQHQTYGVDAEYANANDDNISRTGTKRVSLNEIVIDLERLWIDSVLSMDNGLALLFLQSRLTKSDNSIDAMLESYNALGTKHTPATTEVHSHGNRGGRRGKMVSNMQSYGLLNSSRISFDLLSATQKSLEKMVKVCEDMVDTNQSYPAMLMLEIVSDCISRRIQNQVAFSALAQQSYDSRCAVYAGQNDLPVLMPNYDLTFIEFKDQLQAQFSDQVELEIIQLNRIEPASGSSERKKFEALFDLVREKIDHELDESHHSNSESKSLRVEALTNAVDKARKCGLHEDAELGEKLLTRISLEMKSG